MPNRNSSTCEGSEMNPSGISIVQQNISPGRTGRLKEKMKGKVREENYKGLSRPSLETWTIVHGQ